MICILVILNSVCNTNKENDSSKIVETEVAEKLLSLKNKQFNFTFSEFMMRDFFRSLKSNSSAGRLTAEHLNYACNRKKNLIEHLCNKLSLCFLILELFPIPLRRVFLYLY